MSYVNVLPVKPAGRTPRRPSHPYQLRFYPQAIQPFCIAPVLPGETLKNAVFQCRAVTDPIKNPLVGWWLEHYLFYVKIRDLLGRDTFTPMFLDPDADISSQHSSTTREWTYHRGAVTASVDWVYECTKVVVNEWFRGEGEDYTDNVIAATGQPLAAVMREDFTDSLTLDAPLAAADIDFTDAGSASGVAVTAEEVEQGLAHWRMLRLQNLTDMSFEDYLRAHGVRRELQELHVPELLRYTREWQYPSNTIDPTNGTPRSAVSWSIAERVDKDRYFAEPGFILGLVVARPKLYSTVQKSTASVLLDDAFSWLPAMLRNDPATSLKLVAESTPPFEQFTTAPGYWVDLRDLFIYGEQFINFDIVTADNGSAAGFPFADLTAKDYVLLAGMQNLFVDETGASGLDKVRCDGIINFNILSHQSDDHTPSSGPR